MAELERKAVEKGISVEELMENAGSQVFNAIKEKCALKGRQVIVFAGSGNNGGDGFVATRYLARDCPVIVLFFGEEEKLGREAKLNYSKIKDKINGKIKDSVRVIKIKDTKQLDDFSDALCQQKNLRKNTGLILVDALLGTGIKGKIREPISAGIDYFNSLSGFKVAVDLPSGLDPDTGKIRDKVCNVDLIVCFHELKTGLEKFKEKTVVADIGI